MVRAGIKRLLVIWLCLNLLFVPMQALGQFICYGGGGCDDDDGDGFKWWMLLLPMVYVVMSDGCTYNRPLNTDFP